MTLSQLMADSNNADFAFDLSCGATSSLFSNAPLFPGDTQQDAEKNDSSAKKLPIGGGGSGDAGGGGDCRGRFLGGGDGSGRGPSTKATPDMNKSKNAAGKRQNDIDVANQVNDDILGGGGGGSGVGGGGVGFKEVSSGDAASTNATNGENNKRVKWSESSPSSAGRNNNKAPSATSAKPKDNVVLPSSSLFSSPFEDGLGSHAPTHDAMNRKDGKSAVHRRRDDDRGGGGEGKSAAVSCRSDGTPSLVAAPFASSLPLSAKTVPSAGGVNLRSGKTPPDVPPLFIPSMFQQQKQQTSTAGVLRQQHQQQLSPHPELHQHRSGPASHPPARTSASHPRSPAVGRPISEGSSMPSNFATVKGAAATPGTVDRGSAKNPVDNDVAAHHLFRPVAAAFKRVAAEMPPIVALEKTLDDVILHLDQLDAKCDAKLEELMRKKQEHLRATEMMRSAFK